MDEQDQQQIETNQEQNSWSLPRLLGLLLVIVAALAALYILVGYTAWQSGQSIRSANEEAQMAEQLTHQ